MRLPFRFNLRRDKEILNPAKGNIAIYKTYQILNRPSVSFETMATVYETVPFIQQMILFQVDEICCPFTVSGNPEYTTKFLIDGKPMTAVEAVNYFNEQIDMDSLLHEMARDLIAFGNVFVWIKQPTSPCLISPRAVDYIKEEEDALYLTPAWQTSLKTRKIPLKEIIHIKWNPSYKTHLGIGFLEPLLRPYTGSDFTSPNLIETWESIKYNMVEYAKSLGFPFAVISIEGYPDDKIEALSKEDWRSYGNILFTNKPVNLKTMNPEIAASMEKFTNLVFTELMISLFNPMARMFQTPSLAPGSLESLTRLHDRRINEWRRLLKRGIEKIWTLYLEVKGFDPKQAQVRLNWNPTTITNDDIINWYKAGVISLREARVMLAKNNRVELIEGEEEAIEQGSSSS